ARGRLRTGTELGLQGHSGFFCLTRSPGPKPEVEAPDAHRSLLRRFDHLGLQRGRRITVPWKARWPGVLASTPGNGFRVVEEGLSARTTMSDPPFLDGRSAKAVYPIVLETHSPVDAVLIML